MCDRKGPTITIAKAENGRMAEWLLPIMVTSGKGFGGTQTLDDSSQKMVNLETPHSNFHGSVDQQTTCYGYK
jgi:hypothetical protein